MTPVKIASFNIMNPLPDEKALSDMSNIFALRCDAVGLQEVEPRREKLSDHSHYVFVSSIAVRIHKWRIVDHGALFLSKPTFVGSAGPGPSTLRGKTLDWVLLEERKTKQKIIVANCHLAPSPHLNPVRNILHRLQVRRIAKWLKVHQGIPVFVCGDWNYDWKLRSSLHRFRKFKEYGFNPNWTLGYPQPTHQDGEYLDAVVSNQKARSQEVLDGYFSDHRPVVVSYEV